MEGRNNANPNRHVPIIKDTKKMMMTWGERTERKISPPLNLSEGLIDGRSRSRRAIMRLRKGSEPDTQRMKIACTLFAQKWGIWILLEFQVWERTQRDPYRLWTILPGSSIRVKWMAYFDSEQTYKDEYPSPPWSTTDTIHVLDCCRQQTRERARKLQNL